MIREDREFLDQLKEAIRRSADMTWEEFITPLVEDGICDGDGNVLVCAPPTPRTIIDEDGKRTYMLPDLSQPPPPRPRRAKAAARPRARARSDAKTKPRKKPKPGPA
jgi:hypothetical protein